MIIDGIDIVEVTDVVTEVNETEVTVGCYGLSDAGDVYKFVGLPPDCKLVRWDKRLDRDDVPAWLRT